MKLRSSMLLIAVLVLPRMAHAATVLDGTWKQDMRTAKFSGRPLILLLEKGLYACVNCAPPDVFKADGKLHSLTPDHPYYDAASARIASPAEVDFIYAKHGKTIATESISVNPDNMTSIWKGEDAGASSVAPIAFTYVAKRIGNPRPGAHAISGGWIPIRGADSDNGLTITYKSDGDRLTMVSPLGQSYTATIGGSRAAFSGDPGISTVAIRKIGARAYEETDYRGEMVLSVTTTTVAPDGKTARIVSDNKLDGQRMEVTALRQ